MEKNTKHPGLRITYTSLQTPRFELDTTVEVINVLFV